MAKCGGKKGGKKKGGKKKGCAVVAVERFENVWNFVFGYSASGVGESYVKHCVSFLHADCYSPTIGGEFQRVGHQVGE